jgi:hypothetical protein
MLRRERRRNVTDNIIRFPGFINLGAREGKGWQYGCKHYKTFKALVLDLTDRERERTRRWHEKREGRSTYQACELAIAKRGGGDAA